jgi:hypothetical protein
MKVLTKEPGHGPKVAEVEDGLKSMQSLVGGHIERVPIEAWLSAFEGSNIDLWVNEEGKMHERWAENVCFPLLHPDTGRLHDVVVGSVFFASHNDEGETLSLTEKQISLILETMGWSL